jgi:nitrogenase-associated protein
MVIYFYEKIGCANNTRQKELLTKAGFEVISLDILNTAFEEDELLEFFSKKPLNECFNPSAPDIKNGIIDISKLTKREAISKMIQNPILIRRPLMILNDKKILGFDEMERYIKGKIPEDIESCKKDDSCDRDS